MLPAERPVATVKIAVAVHLVEDVLHAAVDFGIFIDLARQSEIEEIVGFLRSGHRISIDSHRSHILVVQLIPKNSTPTNVLAVIEAQGVDLAQSGTLWQRLILILIHRIQPCRIDFELPHRVQFIPQCMFNALDTNIPDIDTMHLSTKIGHETKKIRHKN